MPRTLTFICLAAALLAAPAIASGQSIPATLNNGPEQDARTARQERIKARADEYLAIVRAYRQRDDAAIVRMAAFWDVNEEERHQIWPHIDPALTPAAIVLHVDIALRAFGQYQDELQATHLALAEQLVRGGGSRASTSSSEDERARVAEQTRLARRGFFLLTAWMHEAAGALEATMHHLARAKDAFPDDPDLALVEATAREEMLYGLDRLRRAGPAEFRATRRASSSSSAWSMWIVSQERMVHLFERAMTSPTVETALEARLRLALVDLRAGRKEPARKRLDEALATFDRLSGGERLRVRPLEHLAYLFSARHASESADWPKALRDYRIAAGLCPAAAAPMVGRAHAALMAGQEADARATIAALLVVAGSDAATGTSSDSGSSPSASGSGAVAQPAPPLHDRCGGDPWVRYGMGQGWRLEPAMAALRAQVRQ